MTREESLVIASMLVEAYPRDVQEGTLEAYAMHFADLERGAAIAAVKRLVATSKWLPSIAEVRGEVAKASLPAAPSAGEAWTEAVRLMSRIGSYRTLGTAGSPYVNRTLRLCGRWADICQEDLTWLRKRFVELYAEVVAGAREAMVVHGAAPEWLEARPPLVALEGGRQALPRE